MYARFISETKIDTTIPKHGRDAQGRLVTGDLSRRPDVLALLDYHPVDEEDMPSTVVEGRHYEKRYSPPGSNDAIVQYWVLVDDPQPVIPNRSISKYKLKLEIAKLGLLDRFREMLSGIEVAPGYDGLEAFNDATTLDENNELVVDAKRALRDNFGLTDDEIEGIVSESVAE